MVPFRHSCLVSSQYGRYTSFKVIGTMIRILIDIRTIFSLQRIALLIHRELATNGQAIVSGTYPSDTGIEHTRQTLGIHLRFIVEGFYGIQYIADGNLGLEGCLSGAYITGAHVRVIDRIPCLSFGLLEGNVCSSEYGG